MTQAPGARQQAPFFRIVEPYGKEFNDFTAGRKIRDAIGSDNTVLGTSETNAQNGNSPLQSALGSLMGLIPGGGIVANAASQAAVKPVLDYYRRQELDRLAGLGKDLTMKNGYYDQLKFAQRRLLGVSDQAVTNVVGKERLDGIRDTDAYQTSEAFLQGPEGGNLTEDQVIKQLLPKGAATDIPTLRSRSRSVNDTQSLLADIKSNPESLPTLLAAQNEKGKALSLDDLQKVQSDAYRQTQAYKAVEQSSRIADAQEKRAIERDRESVLTSQNTRRNQDAATELARVQADNNQTNKIAEIDYLNKSNDYKYQIAERQADDARESSQLDRTLRRDLAVLGIDDRQNDREFQYARDERRDRQLMMLQLLKGLGQLGNSFALQNWKPLIYPARF